MKLKDFSSILVFFLVLFPTERSVSQEILHPTPPESKDDSARDGSVRVEIPLGAEYPSLDFGFVVEKPKKGEIPLQLASRLFSETIGSVVSVISPNHKVKVRLFLTLRLGQKSDNVSVRRGNPGSTVIDMREWDDVLFAEMLARAVLGSIVSESELDDAARVAVRRARGTVSVNELRSKMAISSTQAEK